MEQIVLFLIYMVVVVLAMLQYAKWCINDHIKPVSWLWIYSSRLVTPNILTSSKLPKLLRKKNCLLLTHTKARIIHIEYINEWWKKFRMIPLIYKHIGFTTCFCFGMCYPFHDCFMFIIYSKWFCERHVSSLI